MKLPCFKRVGIAYFPNNLIGWLILLAGVIFSLYRFIDIDSRSHSAGDTIRPFLINLIIFFIAYNLIAFIVNFLSGKKNRLHD